MNLEPSIWGPHYWTTLHFMSSTYDTKPNQSIKSTMKNFIQSLPVFLPCKECQDHAFEYIKNSDLDKAVSNRKELFTFFFDFHNAVNKRLNKPYMSIKNALEKYHVPKEDYHLFVSSNNHNGWTKYHTLIFVILGLILAYLFFRFRRSSGPPVVVPSPPVVVPGPPVVVPGPRDSFNNIYCGNNALYPGLRDGTKILGSRYQCLKKGIGKGLREPLQNYNEDYAPVDDLKLFCGNGDVLPRNKDRLGTRGECLRKGFAVGQKQQYLQGL